MSTQPSEDNAEHDDTSGAVGAVRTDDVPAEGAGEAGDDAARQTRRRRRRRVLWSVLVFVMLIVLGIVSLVWWRQASYNGNIDRLPGVMPAEEGRPGPNVVGTENWLLVGSDTRVESATTGDDGDLWKPGQQRSDTLMLLHLPADRDKAYVISFPRDSWVPVPGHGVQKINAAFSYGGPPLLIETVEDLTGVRVDHFGAIDFNGFKSMTDALGGVDVHVAKTVYDQHSNITWHAGKNHLDGDKALMFVRQRKELPNGDFDRIKRQQAFLRAVIQKAAEGGTISNPLKLDRFMSAFTKSISVDESVSAGDLRSLAISMRGVRGSDITFLTVPNKGPAWRGKQSVVLLDEAKAKSLYDSVRSAEIAEYVERHGGANSVGTVS
ncbi:LCP family protein [Thermomonospora umbrina]|uniref:LytR family transcriptional attenuator n=1 Tax=Thermomonospora umbrina TaxID=111806 RepID=A0A3D9SZI9_9ACTN|nr:LCP family protein [Thermomonospora umbrina]REE97984.1 LytR family transcriptional attenuator [Thermomonospora umbrina]